jgi:cytochrome c556
MLHLAYFPKKEFFMRKRSIATGLAACFLATVCMAAEPEEEEKKPSYWMEKKLEYSEKILAGLASGDFEAIAKTARSMSALSQMEKWVRSGLPEYRAQLHIFQNANQQLVRTADNENLDGAALAYVQMTLSCVNCHKVVRDSARENPPEKK